MIWFHLELTFWPAQLFEVLPLRAEDDLVAPYLLIPELDSYIRIRVLAEEVGRVDHGCHVGTVHANR